MTASAAHAAVIYIGTSANPTTNEIDGISSAQFRMGRTVLEVTDFKGGDFRQRILGLKDFPMTLSGDWEPGDTNGQTLMKTAIDDGTTVYIRILIDGTNGFEAGYKVSDISFPTEVDGKAQVEYTLVSTTDVTFVP